MSSAAPALPAAAAGAVVVGKRVLPSAVRCSTAHTPNFVAWVIDKPDVVPVAFFLSLPFVSTSEQPPRMPVSAVLLLDPTAGEHDPAVLFQHQKDFALLGADDGSPKRGGSVPHDHSRLAGLFIALSGFMSSCVGQSLQTTTLVDDATGLRVCIRTFEPTASARGYCVPCRRI